MKARIGDWRIPDLDFGLRHAGSADLTNVVITRANRMTKMVQPVMMPSSSLHQSNVGPAEALKWNLLQ